MTSTTSCARSLVSLSFIALATVAGCDDAKDAPPTADSGPTADAMSMDINSTADTDPGVDVTVTADANDAPSVDAGEAGNPGDTSDAGTQ